MPERTEQIAVSLSPAEKATVRENAAAADQSMSAFVRERVLEGLPMDTGQRDAFPEEPHPLDDFKTAELSVDETTGPVAKREVYARYVAFCEAIHPDHEIETQHKVSREIASMDGVETGRVYLSTDGANPTRTRCFLNLTVAGDIKTVADSTTE